MKKKKTFKVAKITWEEFNKHSLCRYIANVVEITGTGIIRSVGLPKITDSEIRRVDIALNELYRKQKMTMDWYTKYCSSTPNLDACQVNFFTTKYYEHFDDCAYGSIWLLLCFIILNSLLEVHLLLCENTNMSSMVLINCSIYHAFFLNTFSLL